MLSHPKISNFGIFHGGSCAASSSPFPATKRFRPPAAAAGEPFRVFVGYDPRENEVCRRNLLRRSSGSTCAPSANRTSAPRGTSVEALEATGKRPSDFADTLGLPFEFCSVAEKAGDVYPEKLGVMRRDAVAVHWLHHSLYDVTGSDSNTLWLIQRREHTTWPSVDFLMSMEQVGVLQRTMLTDEEVGSLGLSNVQIERMTEVDDQRVMRVNRMSLYLWRKEHKVVLKPAGAGREKLRSMFREQRADSDAENTAGTSREKSRIMFTEEYFVVPAVVKLAKEALPENKCIVIGLKSTGEARTEEAVTKYGNNYVDSGYHMNLKWEFHSEIGSSVLQM
ncbi:hypothetical protein EJB05_48906, partial [Eragrostis curvula]